LETLCKVIADQIRNDPVEHLVLLDNKKRTVGEKRDALMRAARGDYISFVDDDDMIALDYVALILQKIRLAPDVITFMQQATVAGLTGLIDFGLKNENQTFTGVNTSRPVVLPVTKRAAWHI